MPSVRWARSVMKPAAAGAQPERKDPARHEIADPVADRLADRVLDVDLAVAVDAADAVAVGAEVEHRVDVEWNSCRRSGTPSA